MPQDQEYTEREVRLIRTVEAANIRIGNLEEQMRDVISALQSGYHDDFVGKYDSEEYYNGGRKIK